MTERSKKKNFNLQEKHFLFLVNLTEREHSQGQTWGETAVIVGIKEKKRKQTKQEHFSLLSKKLSPQLTKLNNFSHFVSGANDDNLSEIRVSISALGENHMHDDVK